MHFLVTILHISTLGYLLYWVVYRIALLHSSYFIPVQGRISESRLRNLIKLPDNAFPGDHTQHINTGLPPLLSVLAHCIMAFTPFHHCTRYMYDVQDSFEECDKVASDFCLPDFLYFIIIFIIIFLAKSTGDLAMIKQNMNCDYP